MNHGKKRLIYVLALIAIMFGVFFLRLAWLQIGFAVRGAAASRQAVFQRTDRIVVDAGRGQFADRTGKPITGETVQALIAFPTYGKPRGTPQALQRVAESLGTDAVEFETWLRKLTTPAVWSRSASSTGHATGLSDAQIRAIRQADLNGIAILPYRNRYPDDMPALHAIGYVSQDPQRLARLYPRELASHQIRETDLIGGAGLEKSMDRLLRGVGPTVVHHVTDAARRPLEGLGLRMSSPGNPHFPLEVRTTLDLSVQNEVIQAMQSAGVRRGAAVVLDVANADILAMVSLPHFNPEQIGAPGTDERNRAITAYAPGSVFKIVTMAAALEAGEVSMDTRFHCTGTYGRYGLKCWKHDGHGMLNLPSAFAQSCNVAFAAMADGLDPAWIQVTAERLGLGRQIGWATSSFVDGQPLRLLEEEEAGRIFLSRETANDGGVRAGTGIGQRDVRITSLQAANLVVTLLHGGRVLAPRLVHEIRYADGSVLARLPEQTAISRYGQIRPQTAAAVLGAMRLVVAEGTAKHALSDAPWPLAGKSGTAELAGRMQSRNDHWFVGYGPADGKPRYAIAVLVQEQPDGLRNRATAVFGDIMARLSRLTDAKQHPIAVRGHLAAAVRAETR
jgi:cell division protein FtsI/penicillin-binding protein 2